MSLPVPVDNQTGRLGARVLATDLTINLGTPWTGPTVAAPNYTRLVLDPSLIGIPNSLYEVAYVTVINGSSTATVSTNGGGTGRGMEGTTPVGHALNANWHSGSTAADIVPVAHAELAMAASLVIPTGVLTQYALDTVESSDGRWNPATFSYTVGVAGRYEFAAVLDWATQLATAQALYLYRSGLQARVLAQPSPTVPTPWLRGSTKLICAIGDVMSFWVAQFSGTNQGPGGNVTNNYASIEYLGPV